MAYFNFTSGSLKRYELLNKDVEVARFSVDRATESVVDFQWSETGVRPIGFGDIASFISSRKAPSNRAHIRRVLHTLGADTFTGYLDVVHALSVNDTFWVRRVGEDVSWADANLFDNELNEAISRIAFEGGLVGQDLDLSTPSPEPSLDGSFAKCVIRHDGSLYIMKAPTTEEGGERWHPWSEVMSYQVARAMGVDCVPYSLVERVSGTSGERMTATICPLFTSASVGYAPARRWLSRPVADYAELLGAYASVGSETAFRRMVVLDALTLNVDRHMGNHGILFDTETLEPLGMAPVFDNNLSFCPRCVTNPADGFYRHARENCRPAIGSDFVLVARTALTDDIAERLDGLRSFSFDRKALAGMPEERVSMLEGVVRAQAEAILSDEREGFNLTSERELELKWQLDGWPEDSEPDEYSLSDMIGEVSLAESQPTLPVGDTPSPNAQPHQKPRGLARAMTDGLAGSGPEDGMPLSQ